MKENGVWLCETCCWLDENITCLKSPDHNFDGDGIKGVTECKDYVIIDNDCVETEFIEDSDSEDNKLTPQEIFLLWRNQ